jgi:hypothetical protein
LPAVLADVLVKKVYFLADPGRALEFRNTDTDDRNMRALAQAILHTVQVTDPIALSVRTTASSRSPARAG